MIRYILLSLIAASLLVPASAFADEAAKKADQKNSERKTRTDWAEIKLTGSYPEHQQMPGLFGELVEGLSTCMDRLHQAARDKSIKGVILHIDSVEIGWARLNELQSAIAEVKAAGKPIWARMNDGGNKDYLLAASCDRILMPESGTLMLTGLRAEIMFYKNLFEMLDVKADMLRVGAFKSAAEPYTRSEMSPEFRQEMEEILDDYYAAMVSQIAAVRKLPEDKVKSIIDEGMFSAARAKDLGLIDDVAYHDQIGGLIANGDESLEVRIREDYRKKKASAELDLFTLMEILSGSSSQSTSTRPRIAVLKLEGAIVSDKSPMSMFSEASISSDRIVPLIEKLGKDDNVKAIILRVDSPGGSALASDLIWRALEATNKPVIASMGDTAASGGYYISMGADAIFAEPGTLTGSIGVLGGKIALDGLMKKFGVTTSVIHRGKNSGVMSSNVSFSDSEREAMQKMLNTVYDLFTKKAAEGRHMDHAALEALARGRVYTGRQAKKIGLVDQLGTLADAVAYTRKFVGDDDGKLELEDLPKAQSPLEMLMGQANSSSQPLAAWSALLPESTRPALRHFAALRLIADEPVLMILPFDVRFE
ncbi:MAG TPA: signal peptide peptidase SppA [Planctomycetaceae bacterium]|nr:signal peptide peptidase SppA [Planctomycetaceae bacterium]